jgi:cytochrome c
MLQMLTDLLSKQFYMFSPGTIILSLIFSLLFASYLFPDTPSADDLKEQTKPEVIIESPVADRSYSWGSQVRYSIHVSDEKDGESRFGEINPFEVLLEVEYLSSISDQINIVRSEYEKTDEHIGLTLIRKSDCFSCHADKLSLVGPSFSEISNRYDSDSPTLQKLGEHIIKGSSGDWGDFLMPPHNNITKEEAIEMADFILKQGSRENQWIYSGLEGVFRVIEKPDSADSGLYRLTASYINSGTESVSGSGIRGEHTIFLKIE